MTYDAYGITWNTSDLEGCKMALELLYDEGVPTKELRSLDFGSLWVDKVLEELEAGRS